MIEKETFIFHLSWMEAIADFPIDVKCEILDMIIAYAKNRTVPNLSPVAKVAFKFIKKDMDNDTQRWEEIINARREAGLKGAQSRWQSHTKDGKNSKAIPKMAKDGKAIEGMAKIASDGKNGSNDNINVIDDNYVITENIKKEKEEKSEKEEIDFGKIIEFFNETTKGVFGTLKPPMGATRKSMVRARIAEHGMETFEEVIRMAVESDFLTGHNNQGWRASFDWLIKPTNFEKVLSGNYVNHEKPQDHYKGDDTIGKHFVRRGID